MAIRSENPCQLKTKTIKKNIGIKKEGFNEQIFFFFFWVFQIFNFCEIRSAKQILAKKK